MQSGYVLARIKLKYGAIELFNEIMSHLVPVLGANGCHLRGAYQTTIGRLWEVWDLWEVTDASRFQSALAAARQDPDFQQWAKRLPECVEEEDLRYMTELPYSP